MPIMKKNVMIILGSLLFLAVFFVFALGSIVEQTVTATEEPSWIEVGYVPAARCGRTQTTVMAEPVSLGVGQDRLTLVSAASPLRTGKEAHYPVSVITAPNGGGGQTLPSRQILLQPSFSEPSSPKQMPFAPDLLADGPVSRSSDHGTIYNLRVQVINTAAGQELPYPGVVRNLMSLFFDLEPGQEPIQPVASAV